MRLDTGAGMSASPGGLGGSCEGSGPGAGGDDKGVGGRGNRQAVGATTGGGMSAWAGLRCGGPSVCVRSMGGGTIACV